MIAIPVRQGSRAASRGLREATGTAAPPRDAVSGADAHWVDFSGPVGGGHRAGITVFPDPRDHQDIWWFVADWGVVTVGPFRLKERLVRRGEELLARYRVLVHDGADTATIADAYAAKSSLSALFRAQVDRVKDRKLVKQRVSELVA